MYHNITFPDAYVDGNGYLRYYSNDKLVHREMAEKMLGRKLLPGEVVHHKDRDKLNNHPDNLWVFPTQAEHDRIHRIDARRHGRMVSYQGFPKTAFRTPRVERQVPKPGQTIMPQIGKSQPRGTLDIVKVIDIIFLVTLTVVLLKSCG